MTCLDALPADVGLQAEEDDVAATLLPIVFEAIPESEEAVGVEAGPLTLKKCDFIECSSVKPAFDEELGLYRFENARRLGGLFGEELS